MGPFVLKSNVDNKSKGMEGTFSVETVSLLIGYLFAQKQIRMCCYQYYILRESVNRKGNFEKNEIEIEN